MTKLFLKRNLLIGLMMWCSFSFAQKKIILKYYENNTLLPIENVKFFIVTKSDTLIPKIIKEKIQLDRNMKDNFSLFAKIDNNIINVGSYRPKTFEENHEIIIGRITDFSALKVNWEFTDTFQIGPQYLIKIPNSNTIADLVYSIVVKYVDVSTNTDFTSFVPQFTPWYEVIKRKN